MINKLMKMLVLFIIAYTTGWLVGEVNTVALLATVALLGGFIFAILYLCWKDNEE